MRSVVADEKTLEEIKPGDFVMLVSGFGSVRQMKRVTKVTPTQIVVGDRRFRRKDGNAVGGSDYHSPSIYVVDSKTEREVNEAWQKRVLAKRIREVELSNLSVNSLVKIALEMGINPNAALR